MRARYNQAGLVILCVIFGWVAILTSCNEGAKTYEPPKPETFAPPVVEPLKLSKAKKLPLDSIKSTPVKPEVKSFSLDELPVQHYDTDTYKPEKYTSTETKLDFSTLPSKPLDIDKLPSKPLKFKTYPLSPPKLIKAGPRRLINSKMAVFELGQAEGLKADTISAVYTDSDGFVWIGTDRGLYRYDGENFWHFDNLPLKNSGFCILQDKKKRLWVQSFDEGLQVIDIKNGTVSVVDRTSLSTDSVNKMLIDDKQRIWLGTWNKGVSIIDLQTQTVKQVGKKEGLSGNINPNIAQDREHNIWLGSTWGDGLNFIDLKNKRVSYINRQQGLRNGFISAIMCDRAGRVWAGSAGAIYVIDPVKGSLQTIDEAFGNYSGNIPVCFTEDNKGRIWVGKSFDGIEIIDPGKQIHVKLNNTGELSSRFVTNLSQDKQGQIWVAELTNLNMIEPNKVVLGRIGSTPTTSLFEDHNGLIWRAGDFDGVNIIDRQKKMVRALNSTNGFTNDTMGFLKEYKGNMLITNNANLYVIDSLRRTITILGKRQGFTSPTRSWAFDKKGNMWLGGYSYSDNGMAFYNPVDKTIKRFNKSDGIRDNDEEDMCTDKDGNIWISTYNKGVGMIDPLTNEVRFVENTEFNSSDQRMLLADRAGNIWVSGTYGLSELNLAKKTLTFFTKKQGLIDKNVSSLLEHNGRIYAGTIKGTTIITPPDEIGKNKDWHFERFGAFLGLNKKVGDPQSDLVTKDGTYWMGDMGITAFDLSARDTGSYPVYITGLNIMDEPGFFAGDVSSQASGMRWDKVDDWGNIPVNLHLAYDKNLIQFNYSVLDPARHDTVYYKYKLAGTDKDWNEQTSTTFSHNYINLAPGYYTFEVSCKNYNGTWSKPAVLSFTINLPWWRTWWACVLYAVLLAGSIWGFSYYRSLQLIREKRILEHKVHIRTEEVLQQKEEISTQRDHLEQAFEDLKNTQSQLVQREKMASLGELTAGIAHEIQNPLNFVNNFSDVNQEMLGELEEELNKGDITEAKAIAADIRENEKKINHHGKRADFIVKGMLQHSRTSTGERQLTNMNVLADEFFRLSYHGLRAKDKSFNAELTTHFDEDLPKVNVVQQDMGRVLLNLFNNAFYAVNQKSKTAGTDYKPEVTVATSTANGQVIISVKDNGVGIPDTIKDKIMQPFFTTKPTGEGTGLGLSLSYDILVKGHSGTLDIISKEGEGAEFIVHIPNH